jgi:hypothetical protein
LRYPRDLIPRRPRPGPRGRPRSQPWWLAEAGLAGRPSFVIAPLLACSGAAGYWANRGVLLLYRVIAPAPPLPSARPLRPGLEDGYLALIRQHARTSARSLPD